MALTYGVATVCVKPSHVLQASRLLKGSRSGVSTVIGFPHGTTTTRTKVCESLEAIDNGAVELDMVINLGKLLSGEFKYVTEDIRQVVEAAYPKGVPVKVIIETALLGDEMKAVACKLATEAGADYVKTSTGFNGGGATLKDIEIMRNAAGPAVKLKASGGIKNFMQAVEFANAGCSRLGTSSTEQILEGMPVREGAY